MFVWLRKRRPPRSTRKDTLLPNATVFRSEFDGRRRRALDHFGIRERALEQRRQPRLAFQDQRTGTLRRKRRQQRREVHLVRRRALPPDQDRDRKSTRLNSSH